MIHPPKPCIDPPCAQALEQAKRVGRAHYVCPRCGMDVSLHWFLWRWAESEGIQSEVELSREPATPPSR